MVTELLLGLLFTSLTPDFSNFFLKPEISITRPTAPQRPTFNTSSTPTPTPTPTSTPAPSPTPTTKPSSTPAATQSSTKLTTQSILKALNDYRAKKGAGSLQLDATLQSYAQNRADYLKSIGKLDGHAAHRAFMNDGGFAKLGFNSVAENQGWNYKGDAVGLIEKFYGTSSGHNKNQLNSTYTHVGIGINGPFTNLVFGGRKR